MNSKKAKEILANYRGARVDKEEFESMMEDIIDKHLSVKQREVPPIEVETKQQVNTQSSLVSSPLTQTEPTLDATHTASERSVYSLMYRLTVSQGKKECYITNTELRKMTGIGSHNTIREAIKGLIAKASIEKVGGQDCSHYGTQYRIYKPREILTRRRQIGIEIEIKSKRIVSSPASSPTSSPASSPASSPIFGRGPLPKIGDEERAVLLNRKNEEIDDDSRARAREVHNLLRSFFPEADPDRIKQACEEIDQLLAAELQEQVKHAKTPPVSPQYFVECIRHLCRASQRGETSKQTSGKQSNSRSALKRKIEALAKQVREVYVGGDLTFADFCEVLKRACAREALSYDTDLITEVVTELFRRRHN